MLECKLEDGVSLNQNLRTGGLCDVCRDPATKIICVWQSHDVVRFCDKHHCEWLYEVNGRQIDQDEASLLTKQIVLDNWMRSYVETVLIPLFDDTFHYDDAVNNNKLMTH